MAHAPLAVILRHVHQLLDGRPADRLTDGQLLEHFVTRRDETAFAALLQRHGPMVLATCRRVLRHAQDAEDVFQATFLLLARRAGAIRWREAVGGWLHGVAYRLAVKLKARDARRRAHERQAGELRPRALELDAAWRELQAVLDEELGRLPEKYRAPLVLCYLEGLTHDEAARFLGWPAGTVKSRLARAREMLGARLARRGLALAVAPFAALLAASAAPAVLPAPLLDATLKAALRFADGAVAAGTVSAQAVGLAQEGLRAALLTKLQVGMALLLTGMLAAGGAALVRPAPAAKQPADRREEASRPEPNEEKPTRTDFHGDPLPPGAIARMGTVRLRHTGAPVAFTPDGKTLISVGGDLTLRYWDPLTGREVRRKDLPPPVGLSDPGYLIHKLTPDGKTLVFGGRNASGDPVSIHVWDAMTGKERCTIATSGFLVLQLALSADGKTLAAVADRYTVRLWDTVTGIEGPRLKHNELVWRIALSPDSKVLASVSGDSAVHLWDVATGKELHNLPEKAIALAFSPDGKTLVSEGNKTVKLWDVATGKEQATFQGPEKGEVRAVAFSPDGARLAVAGGQDLVLWEVATRKELLRRPVRFVGWLAFAPDGQTLAASGGFIIHLWDVATGKALHAWQGHEGGVDSIAYSPDGKVLCSASHLAPALHLWDAATGKLLRLLQGHEWGGCLNEFSADGKLLVSRSGADTVRLWEVSTGKELRKFTVEDLKPGPNKPLVLAFRLSPDGRRLAAGASITVAGGYHYQISLWDAATGRLLTRRPLPDGTWPIRFTPDGAAVICQTAADVLTLQEVATGRELATFPPNLGLPVAFSPDGKVLAAGSVRRFDLPAVGKAPEVFGGQGEAVYLVDAATGKPFLRIAKAGWPGFLAFSPDGRLLATADTEAVRLWEVATGKEVFRIRRHENFQGSRGDSFVSCLAFSPTGRTLATGHHLDTTVLVWDLAPESARAKDLDAEDLDRLWADLAGEDAARAYRAMVALAAAPAKAAPFLKSRLRPAPEPDAKRTQRLLADLDSDQFAVREAAATELAKLGEQIEPALRRVLRGTPSPEVRRRVEALIDNAVTAARGPVHSAERLRTLRALQALEGIGTPEARRVLQTLAAGAAAARETRAAKEALERLSRQIAAAP